MSNLSLRLTLAAATGAVGTTAVHGADLLWDNGMPNEKNGYSNATSAVFGFRRTLLDDFVVPEGEIWRVSQILHTHVWGNLKTELGTGMDIALRSDLDGTPGALMQALEVTDYKEHAVICIFFSRPVNESWTTFEPVTLEAGRYWFEAAIMGPENNFWITADQRENECWVNYQDLGGFQSGTEQFGVPSDINWMLYGARSVIGDTDGDGDVDFQDILSVIAGWGPCPPGDPCPADVDGDGDVDYEDLQLVLASWT